ncbi:GGDEF domain-containing protein [Actinoplanes sp. NEAU-A12]|uniref:GGDEF domain-containing protein n=1 Tax=Actinoplanes sandaracinus TaxID=3045177 RepID=A0ABT6WNB7_9ACTN|nr:GGDEF domain-containing protein [Actinoplanes sandaracinus]MDI6101212.1 GGDEF domain-containing protein [Actinoplanes sandaracinus]
MTTETASRVPTEPRNELGALESAVAELEERPMSQFRTVWEPAAELRRRATELGAEEVVQRAMLLQAGVLLREGETGEGGRLAHQVRVWAEQHESCYLLARAHRELSVFYRVVGDFSDSLNHAVQCVAFLSEEVPPHLRARHLSMLSVALDDTGSHADGKRRAHEALSAAAGDHEMVSNILNNMAYTAVEVGDEPEARALVAQMREVQARSGIRFSANQLDTMAQVELMGGRYEAVEDLLSPVLADLVAANEGDAVAECQLTLSQARRLAGRFDDAQAALDATRKVCTERGMDGIGARARQEQAALFAATGRFAEAYEEHRAFHAAAGALQSVQRDARARALQAVLEANEARRASEHFREMAHRDALTGLYNRRYVNERVPALLLESAARRRPLSLAIIDLDHFKRVNDTLSHSTGDTVLQHVAELLEEAAVGSAIAARMGGEEFLLVYPGVDADEAAVRCERLRLRIRAHGWEPITGTLPVTTSIGITTAVEGRSTFTALLAVADRNLYAAKRSGRDRVVAG